MLVYKFAVTYSKASHSQEPNVFVVVVVVVVVGG
jgi:hypothetical protein